MCQLRISNYLIVLEHLFFHWLGIYFDNTQEIVYFTGKYLQFNFTGYILSIEESLDKFKILHLIPSKADLEESSKKDAEASLGGFLLCTIWRKGV
jgi:hypothetical protein